MEPFVNVLNPVLTGLALLVSGLSLWSARSTNNAMAALLEDVPSKREARELVNEMTELLERFTRDAAAERMRKRRARERSEPSEAAEAAEGGEVAHATPVNEKDRLWAIVHARGLTKPPHMGRTG